MRDFLLWFLIYTNIRGRGWNETTRLWMCVHIKVQGHFAKLYLSEIKQTIKNPNIFNS